MLAPTRPPCDVCLKLAAQSGLARDCDDCIPPLQPENLDAARVYFATHRQVIYHPSGRLVDVQHGPVHAAMDLYSVEDRRRCFEAVCRLFREVDLAAQEEQD